ncbi:MAG: penicillin-binding protein 2 [Nitrospirae bacterium CG_4_9_14_3_um_filter_53_35]|nr:MAG: penicillin-binding protein 2 [Nitrospirae bacterium CG_4_9_14_3_um_filter_53_35]
MILNINDQALTPYQSRVKILSIVLAVFFVVLISRAWYLQIMKGGYFKERSERQRIRVERVVSPRGEFVDRNGVLLGDTKPGFDLTITLEDVRDLDQTLARLSQLLGIPASDFYHTIRTARENGVRVFQPIRLLSNADWETVALIEVNHLDLAGVSIIPEPFRNYRDGDLFAHLFGYIGEINPAELMSGAYRNYRIGDVIGKAGLEKSLESYLKGRDGVHQIEVNSVGRVIEEISYRPPESGNRAVLTMDYDLQKALEDAFGDYAGAGVVINPNNGEVLAMISRPAYDPNLFPGGIAKEYWRQLILDPKHPLTNKAISGQYPPGSVFKIVMSIAALEEHKVTPNETLYCRGYTFFGGRAYRCWRKQGHGAVYLHRAIVESCDVYFYEMGQRLGIDRIAYYAKGLGLGNLTGIGMDGEKPGLIPTREWKKKATGEPWYPGENLSAAIGQGYVLVTPFQLADLIGAVANGGTVYRPQLVKRIENYKGETLKAFSPQVLSQIHISPETLNLVRDALEDVVSEPQGTGGKARINGIRIAGKTGTAQVIRMNQQGEKMSKELAEKYQDHAWFVACGPMEKPEIAVAVIMEHGGHGGSAAAPIVRKVMEAYFKKTGRMVEPPPELRPASLPSDMHLSQAANLVGVSGEPVKKR